MGEGGDWQREAGGCRRQISGLEKIGQFIKIPGSSGDCCLLGKAMCVFGAEQAGWELSRHFPSIPDEQHTTPLLGGSHHRQGEWGYKLPLCSHKNNVVNWEGTKMKMLLGKLTFQLWLMLVWTQLKTSPWLQPCKNPLQIISFVLV